MKRFTVLFVLAIGCTDDEEEPTQDFGQAIECDGGKGILVDHGYRSTLRVDYDCPTCMPKCGSSPVCPSGKVFYTVPVEISDRYPSGNACFCDEERLLDK